jgi:hypothetical protein
MFKRTAGRLVDVARDVAGSLLVVASGGLEDLGCIVRGWPESPQPPVPSPRLESSGWCEDCQSVHDAPARELPPELALRLAVMHAQRKQAEPQGSTLVDSVTWVPAFAFDVRPGSLLALDGPSGRRALRVTRLLRGERQVGYGTPVEVVTFLLVDAESGDPGSLTAGLDEPLTVAFEVPDSAASLGGAS